MSEILKDPNRIKAIAEGVFGPDRVDFNYTRRAGESEPFNLTVHFPELIVRNSENARQQINDLFVNFSVTFDSAVNGGYVVNFYPSGTRLTFSLKEAQSGYTHSHLPRVDAMYMYQSFCLGSSNFAMIIENLKLNGTEEDWELMFLSLTHYVSWESLEGGPYIKIRDIMYQNQSRTSTVTYTDHDYQQELSRLINHLPRSVWEFTPEMQLIENHPELYTFFNTYSRIRKRVAVQGNQGNGPITQAMLDQAIDRLQSQRSVPFIFKGRTIRHKVWDPSITAEAQLEGAESNHIEKEVFLYFVNLLKNKTSSLQKIFQYDAIKSTCRPHYRALSPFK